MRTVSWVTVVILMGAAQFVGADSAPPNQTAEEFAAALKAGQPGIREKLSASVREALLNPNDQSKVAMLDVVGKAYLEASLYAEAADVYAKAISLSPTNAAYHAGRAAALLLGSGKNADALASAVAALEIDKDTPLAWAVMARVSLATGDVEGAQKSLLSASIAADKQNDAAASADALATLQVIEQLKQMGPAELQEMHSAIEKDIQTARTSGNSETAASLQESAKLAEAFQHKAQRAATAPTITVAPRTSPRNGVVGASAPPSPPLQAVEEPIQFKTVSLDDLFGGPPAGMDIQEYFPITIDIPAIYTRHQNPSRVVQMIWSTESDFERVTQEGKPRQEHGYFSVQVSMNLGYDTQKDTFTDFQGMHEKNIRAKFSEGGLEVTEVKRDNAKGFPVLIIEGQSSEGRKARIAYVATKVDTNVLFIHYIHRNPWSNWDEEVWGRFKSTLLAAS